jgi:uncharacterized protein (TIGR03435 family)
MRCAGFAHEHDFFDQTGSIATWNLAANGVTLAMLAATLADQNIVDRIVLDRTGLDETFDFSVQIAPPQIGPSGTRFNAGLDVMPNDPSGLPSIFTGLNEQLRLRLERTTGSVDVLVIDHVERPSPN